MAEFTRTELLRSLLDDLVEAHVSAALCVDQLRRELEPVLEGRSTPPGSDIRLERTTFRLLWNGRTCDLGRSVGFRLIERLVRSRDRYLSYEQLLRDVWHGDRRSPQTVRSTVRHLRTKLISAGMPELATAIRSRGRCYGLILPKQS